MGPEDDYDEEEDNEELDEEFDQMAVPEEEMNKRQKIEEKRNKDGTGQ